MCVKNQQECLVSPHPNQLKDTERRANGIKFKIKRREHNRHQGNQIFTWELTLCFALGCVFFDKMGYIEFPGADLNLYR